MDKETYEALKRIISWVDEQDLAPFQEIFDDTMIVEKWIKEEETKKKGGK